MSRWPQTKTLGITSDSEPMSGQKLKPHASGNRGGERRMGRGQGDRQGPWRMGEETGRKEEGTRRPGAIAKELGEGTGTPGAIGRGMGGQGGIGRPGRSRGEAEDRRGHSVATGNCEEDGGGDWER